MAEGSAGRRLRDLTTLFGAGTHVGLTDGELLRRAGAATGEEAEAFFEAIVDRHGPMVHRVCRGTLGDAADADDAFQATFLVLARRLREARRLESVGGWLHGVATRVSARARVDAARRRKHERARGVLAVVAPDSPNDADADRAVREEVGRLPSRYREVVVLCYWEGLTHEQAAARLGCPLGTVRSRSARARDLLRRRLARRGLAPEGAEAGSIVMPALPAALVRGAARGAAEVAAGRSASGLASLPALELSQYVLRRMIMTKIATLGAVSALLLGAAVGLGRAAYQAATPDAAENPTVPGAAKPEAPVYGEYVVDPPDVLTVEVLEALPGRPISGERLVRPDGRITLGFYGDVYVAGSTIPEIKEKIVLHLRKFLGDDQLGLVVANPSTGETRPVDPKDSNRVSVDVSAYNSKNYYLLGMFAAPGKIPATGRETVLDAVTYAGGLLAGADPSRLTLIRDDPKGGPPRKWTIDLDRIISGEEPSMNRYIRAGDRLIAIALKPEEPRPEPAGGNEPSPRRSSEASAPTSTEDAREPSLRDLEARLIRMEALLDRLSRRLGD